MSSPLRAVIALTAASAACAVLPACASRGDPLAGMNGTQVLQTAASGLRAAPGFTVSGQGTANGTRLDLKLSYERGTGCEGTLTGAGQGSLTLIDIGRTVWARPDPAFWRAHAGAEGPRLAAALGGKYVKSASASGFGGLAGLCDVNSLTGGVPGTVTRDPATVIDGRPVIPLVIKPTGTTVYVTDTAAPKIVRTRTARPGDHGTADITYRTVPVNITAPPARQTIDGSAYGF